jgi:hypothetical protein
MALTATPRWKEELIINDERGRTFTFDCGWGLNPPVAYVPPLAEWRRCVPVWLRERRAEVVEAMKTIGHAVKDGPYSPIAEET